MEKDPPYDTIKFLIESSRITTLPEIFRYMPMAGILRKMPMNFTRFKRAVEDPALFRMEELIVMAELFALEPRKFIMLAYDQAEAVRRAKPAKPKIIIK